MQFRSSVYDIYGHKILYFETNDQLCNRKTMYLFKYEFIQINNIKNLINSRAKKGQLGLPRNTLYSCS